MALFGKRRAMQRALDKAWKDEDDKKALLEELRQNPVKAAAAIPLLWSDDAGVRQVGVEFFIEDVSASATKTLLEKMVSQSRHARAFATRMFTRIPDAIAKEGINALLNNSDVKKSRLGWEIAISLKGELGKDYLIQAIAAAPPTMQLSALRRLIQDYPKEELLDLLIEQAKNPDPRFAMTAVEAVIDVEDPRVVELMIDRFAHGDATLRDRAADYLKQKAADNAEEMRTRMLQLLSEGDDATRRLAVEILFKTGESEFVVQEILRTSQDLMGWLRTRILETLQMFGDEVLVPSLKMLNHEDEDIRTQALVLAERFADPRVVEPVCNLLSAEDWWLRITACDMLGRIKDERAVPHLVKALDDPDARWGAIDALAQIASPTALKPLAKLLRAPRQEVRLEVVQAFSKFDDERLVGLLKKVAAKDPSSEVRTRASEVVRDLSKRLELAEGDAIQTAAISSDQLEKPLDRLLAQVREMGASDCHISADEPPLSRYIGTLSRMEGWDVLDKEGCKEMVVSALNERQQKILVETGEIDFCYAIPEVGRYRANAYVQRNGTCATFRAIPNVPPTFADIRMPGKLSELLDYHQGLILVSGPASSGKSTTLAAFINLINENKSTHVITMEDPIEFVHPVKNALVNQRELGSHTESFERALRGALREDPDVIIVGEMRDTETIRMCLEASETGHLVVATMNTTSCVATVDRLIAAFPPDEQIAVRMALSECLKWVVCQQLIPRADGSGRVALFEILKGTMSVGTLIRDAKTFQIPSSMQIGRKHGMQTVDMALMDLVEQQLITAETAWSRATKQETFEHLCSPGFLAKSSLSDDKKDEKEEEEEA